MRLLLVEDDTRLAQKFSRFLMSEGFAVDVVPDGEDALHLGLTQDYAAAVLDLGLPSLGGMAILEAWRQSRRDLPVLILTARTTWLDKIAGFKAGADDYLVKPFHPEEAVLRLRALIRRAGPNADARVVCGNLVYDSMIGSVTLGGQELKLTGFELRLLTALITRKGIAVSRDHLVSSVYGYAEDAEPGSLEVIMSRLRRKISPHVIEPIRGYGYRLVGCAS